MEATVNLVKLSEICQSNGIEFLGLFGSHAREDNTKDSDVDLLVRFSDPNISIFEHLRIEERLSQVFGNRKIDLVTERALHPYLKKYVDKDLKVLYERQ